MMFLSLALRKVEKAGKTFSFKGIFGDLTRYAQPTNDLPKPMRRFVSKNCVFIQGGVVCNDLEIGN